MWGGELKRALTRYYHDVREIEFETFGEFLPNEGTFVEVSDRTRDRWKIPVAHVHLAPHDDDLRNSRLLADKALDILKAAGADRVDEESVGGTTFVLQHGTCRFGLDPTESVLDKDCRSHEVPNLYVVDGSFMPTSGGVPTTFTIMANSFRVADALVAKFKAGTEQKHTP